MPNISRAKDIGLPVSGSIQDGIVGGIRHHAWPDNHRLNHVGHIGQVPGEACGSARRDLLARLQSRIEEYALDLAKNVVRQDQSMSAEDDVQEMQSWAQRTCHRSNQDVGIERDSHARLLADRSAGGGERLVEQLVNVLFIGFWNA